MSTGLTWVTFGPYESVTDSVIVFNDYDEAYAYGDWLVRACDAHGGTFVRVFIYTSSPNQNGFWYDAGATVQFIAFD